MSTLTKRPSTDVGTTQLGGLIRRMFNEPLLDDAFYRPLLTSTMAWAPAMELSVLRLTNKPTE